MAQKINAGMPPDLDLPANFVISLTAVDPTTGALVSGVNVTNVAIVADNKVPSTAPDSGPILVPTPPEWLNLPIEG